MVVVAADASAAAAVDTRYVIFQSLFPVLPAPLDFTLHVVSVQKQIPVISGETNHA